MEGNEEPGSVRAAAHGDINLLTILPAANEPGLQVQGKDGSWHDVPCDFGTLTISGTTDNFTVSTLSNANDGGLLLEPGPRTLLLSARGGDLTLGLRDSNDAGTGGALMTATRIIKVAY